MAQVTSKQSFSYVSKYGKRCFFKLGISASISSVDLNTFNKIWGYRLGEGLFLFKTPIPIHNMLMLEEIFHIA